MRIAWNLLKVLYHLMLWLLAGVVGVLVCFQELRPADNRRKDEIPRTVDEYGYDENGMWVPLDLRLGAMHVDRWD